MKIRRSDGEQELADEHAWELVNDLALYQTWKPFLDPVTNELAPSKPGEPANTYRAVLIKLESGRAPRCVDRVGTLKAGEDDHDRLLGLLGREHGSTRSAVARALAPVARMLQRVRRGAGPVARSAPPEQPDRFPNHHRRER